MAAGKQGKEPLILEIKGNSLDDGPGIRTVVFFKGCPLDCSWCHNPESKRTLPELSFDAQECVDCGSCVEACARKAIGAPGRIERGRCDLCLDCVDACPSRALSLVGRSIPVEEVVRQVAADKPFFDTSGGGATLSGGEPTLFMDYCSRLLSALSEEGIGTIVETCGKFDLEMFERTVLPGLASLYFDLKIIDDEAHREQCGTTNRDILENFTGLIEPCESLGVELLARVPLVPGITATTQNLSLIRDFLLERGIRRVALLQYNPLWLEKSRKLGSESPLATTESMTRWMDAGELHGCREVFSGFEIV